MIEALSGRKPSVRVFTITGLEGVGRRSYLERVCKDNLGLNLGPSFPYDETKRPEDIYLWLFNENSDLSSRQEIRQEMDLFARLSKSEQVNEIVSRLRSLCSTNCLPCFVDYGGLLTDSGNYVDVIGEILKVFLSQDDDHYLAFIHSRKPLIQGSELPQRIFQQAMPPLNINESRLLLDQLFKRVQVRVTSPQVTELLGYLGGYPPSINLAARHCKEYGIDVLMADKSVLVDFQVTRFAGLIRKIDLNEREWFVLRYLAGELAVPLSVVAIAANVSQTDAAVILRKLIEYSLVVVIDDNYGLSSPIRYAVERAKGILQSDDYILICEKLTKEFWSGSDAAPTVEIVDATLNAAARINRLDWAPYSDLIRVSTLHRLAIRCYHDMDWRQALDYAHRALILDPRSGRLCELRFKCFVRLEKFSDAERMLPDLEATTSVKNYHYLKGFLHWKKQEFTKAMESFGASESMGNKSRALLRDYAECLHRVGRHQEALQRIDVALQRDPSNIFVLDLYIRICLAISEDALAANALAELERYDADRKFVHHRRSTVLAKKGRWQEALAENEKALASGKERFQVHCFRADLLIELKRYNDAAQILDQMRGKFGQLKEDVQLGLRCKLAIRQGDWRKGEVIWQSMKEKNDEFALGMQRQIYELKANDSTLSLVERKDAEAELALLDPDLRSLSALLLDTDLEDT